MATPPIPEPPATARERFRRQAPAMAGLCLTMAGLLFAAGSLPTESGALLRALPLVGAALGALWVGGILLGGAAARRRRR